MTLRWAPRAWAARSKFRRVKGYRQLPLLAAGIRAAAAGQPGYSTFGSQA